MDFGILTNSPSASSKKKKYIIIGSISAILAIVLITVIIAVSVSNKKTKQNRDQPEPLPDPIMSGSGFASRYWDCCKPSCSWTENAGAGNEASQCDAQMNKIFDFKAKSMCDGGPATTCLSQIPIVVTDTLAYAFAAVPGGKNVCGRCFELTFTGEGKYETRMSHRALQGKKLVVMATNIGYDVAGGQFDLLIPGGGVGAFNGCANIFPGSMGKQYGGLLSSCEEEVGYSGTDEEICRKRKQCLINKCDETFTGKMQAIQGCLFLADWMGAAGNPLHTYTEVNCPSQLKERY